jgi:serine/threonine protein kinase
MSKVLLLTIDKTEKNGRSTGLPEKLILKGVRGKQSEEKELKELFEKELARWADIDHENITKCIGLGHEYDVGLLYGERAVKYALIEQKDGDLRGLIKKLKYAGRAFNEEDSLRICLNILITLQDIYKSKGLLHLDLKPSNILYKKENIENNAYKNLVFDVSITDWGISKLHEQRIQDTTTKDELYKTIEGNGTPLYMAPERFARNCKPCISHDIYSIGLILFELYDGNHITNYRERNFFRPRDKAFMEPFEDINDSIEFMSSGNCFGITHNYENSLNYLGLDQSPRIEMQEFWRFMRKCLEKDQTKRFQSHQEAIDNITQMVDPAKKISLKRKTECVCVSMEESNSIKNRVESAFIRYDSLNAINSENAKKILQGELKDIEYNIYLHGHELSCEGIGAVVAEVILPHILNHKCKYAFSGDEMLQSYINYMIMATYCGHMSKKQQQMLKIEKIHEALVCISYNSTNTRYFSGDYDWVCCLLGGPDGSVGEILLFDFCNKKTEDIYGCTDIFPKPTLYYSGIRETSGDYPSENNINYITFLSERFAQLKVRWRNHLEYDEYKFSKLSPIGEISNLPNSLRGITEYTYQWGKNIGY